MIINSETLIGLKRLEDKMKNGEDVYAFYTSTREEAEVLKSVISNQNVICIVVDKKVGETIESKVKPSKKARAVRKDSAKKKI